MALSGGEVVALWLAVEPDLFGIFSKDGLCLVILRARTGPKVAVLRTEFWGLNEEFVDELVMRGIWIRIGCRVCFGSI